MLKLLSTGYFTLLSSGCVLLGCAAQTTTDVEATGGSSKADQFEQNAEQVATDPSQDVVTPELEPYCPGDESFDFNLSGEDFGEWEGKRVYVAAIENDQTQLEGGPNERVVLLVGTITDGGFSLVCPTSLTRTNAYPSWAAFVDVDNDGRCGGIDVGTQQQLYGWVSDVNEVVSSLYEVSAQPGTVAALMPPIGSSSDIFCEGYFHP